MEQELGINRIVLSDENKERHEIQSDIVSQQELTSYATMSFAALKPLPKEKDDFFGDPYSEEEKMQFRYNIMTIRSMEAFVNIKGGYRNQTRDVYFIRALGESADFLDQIQRTDQQMEKMKCQRNLIYKRVSELPKVMSMEDGNYYAQEYDKRACGKIVLKAKSENSRFDVVFMDALNKAMDLFKMLKPHATDTIIRNFAAKLCFWTDLILPEVVLKWNERISAKIIAVNIVKEQEYLFLYLATMLGCDVLILNHKADLKVEQSILALSDSFVLGEYGKSSVPKYVLPEKKKESVPKIPPAKTKTHVEVQGKSTASRSKMMTVQLNTPENAKRQTERSVQQNTPLQSTVQVNPVVPAKRTVPVEQDKGFEELALLASSVVLIAVHDHKGEIIGTGSGIMIGKKGYILTNYHVIKGGPIFAVRIEDHEKVYVTSEVIKYHPDLDLAIIRIDKELTPIPVYKGKTKLVRGQKVVAIGSPLGLFNSVSDGIISGFRNIKNVNMIQFTAPISHGSSGGAVLNMRGEIIGISTAGIDSGQNINLAVGYEDIIMFCGSYISG